MSNRGPFWVDSMDDVDPNPKLEPFFILAAMELGDPEQDGWLMNTSLRFYDMYRKYRVACTEQWTFPESNKALLQYILWYDREKPTQS